MRSLRNTLETQSKVTFNDEAYYERKPIALHGGSLILALLQESDWAKSSLCSRLLEVRSRR